MTFAAPASDGGSAISGYLVRSTPAGGVDANAGSTSRSHRITGFANGDGNLDVVIYAGSTTLVKANGIKLLNGDGQGNFTDATSALPPEIRWMLDVERPGDHSSATFEYQPTGCATLADLDGDGKAEVITGSYSTPDGGPDHNRTIRFHQLGADGRFVERGRVSIPDAIADIEYGYDPPPAVFRGLGCSQILAGDFNGDGRTDLLVQWEGAGKTYVEILRNDGNFQFTGITLEALDNYQDAGLDYVTGHYRLIDVNGDGALDIASQLTNTSVACLLQHTARLNDGSGHFVSWLPQRPSGRVLAAAEVLSAASCANSFFMPLVLDTNKSGLASLVLLDSESSVTTGTPSQTSAVYLTTFAPIGSVTAKPPHYQGLWWKSPAGSESGWGINLTHQADTIFATWFTYDASGKPWWLAFVADRTASGVYGGKVFTTTGPAFNAVPFDPAKVVETTIGTATLTFADGNHATFAYTVNGIAQTKPITRQVFVGTGTVCR